MFRGLQTWRHLFVSILVFVLLVGCTASPQQTTSEPQANPGSSAAGKGTLVISALIEPSTIDVQQATWIDSANTQIYDPLLNYDLNGKLSPGLAERYEVSEDGKVWTFFLRKDVLFHSGEPLTAEAIKKTIERFIQISPVKELAGPVEKVEAVDEHTVKLYFSEAFAPFSSVAAAPFFGALDPKRLAEMGDKFGDNPSGTGPYLFEKHDRGSSITYKRNPVYNWGTESAKNRAAPYVDQVVFRFVKDDDTRILEFKKGTIHILQNVPTNYVQELQNTPGVEILKVPETGIKYLGFNNKKPIFQDTRVKQAISMAIDRDPIIQVALGGFAQPVFGPLPPTIPFHSERIESMARQEYAYNVEKAKALLAEAGWTDSNGDGIVEKDGKPFSVELLLPNEPAFQRVAQIVQNQLKAIGIDLKLAVTETATVRDRTSKASHDMALLYYGYSDPDVLYLMFHSKMSIRTHFSTPELDLLLEKGRRTTNEKERMNVYEEIQELLIKEAPWVPLYAEENIFATRGIEGFKLHPFQEFFILQDVKLTK
ncbi:ABC transporter substrate-binding protein [Brevibacillus ruminantium]|uniref:ABC transporter substrate-binding protein n=1 Tax=Brevibacillus ruminantium TaxID=2950604 RepID=A0ABY4WA54_9BACL|nr:ABC transporter substrate-binding protein [Brevibacillus ruminantium]USG64063.1 ABC transporter substrate-binding protein [Brevibacillus ruminantium]